MTDILERTQAVQAAHQETTRYITAYQNTLVQWTDKEGVLYIGSYLEYLASRA